MNEINDLHFIYFLQGAVVDLSAQGLQKLDPSFTCSEDTYTLILDGNHIMKLDYMERNPGLQQVLKPFSSVLVFHPLFVDLYCTYVWIWPCI